MQSDSDYLQQVIAEDDKMTTEHYMKLQQLVLSIMPEWKTIFETRVMRTMDLHAERYRQAQRPIEIFNQALIEENGKAVHDISLAKLHSYTDYGYTAEDVSEALPSAIEAFEVYNEENKASFLQLFRDDALKSMADIYDPAPYAKLRDRVVKEYCDSMDQRLHSFNRTSKCEDTCFASFVEISDLRFISLESRDLESNIRRREAIRRLRIENKVKFFESIFQVITEENRKFLDKVRTFCPSCSVITKSLENITENCLAL